MVTFEQGFDEEEPAMRRRIWGRKQQEQKFSRESMSGVWRVQQGVEGGGGWW